MDTAQVIKQFLEHNFSKSEAQRRLRVLRDFENWRLFEQKGTATTEQMEAFVEGKLSTQDSKFYLLDGQFLHQLGVDFLNYFEASKLTSQMSALEAGLGKSRIVVMYLALEIPPSEVSKLGGWLKQNVGSDCLIDIQYRSDLIGGAAISYGGRIKDYSLRARIESEKKEILRTLLDFRK